MPAFECIVCKNSNIPEADINLYYTQEDLDTSFKEINILATNTVTQTEKFVKQVVLDVYFAPFTKTLDVLTGTLDAIEKGNAIKLLEVLADLLSTLNALLDVIAKLLQIAASPVEQLYSLLFGDFVNEFTTSIDLTVPDLDSVPSYIRGLSFGSIGEDPCEGWSGSEAQKSLSKLVMCTFLPLLDPLFLLIKKVEEVIKGIVESLIKNTGIAIGAGAAGVLLAAKDLVDGINTLIETIEELMLVIPPTNFIEEKMSSYFEGVGLNDTPVNGFNLASPMTECIIKDIADKVFPL